MVTVAGNDEQSFESAFMSVSMTTISVNRAVPRVFPHRQTKPPRKREPKPHSLPMNQARSAPVRQ